MPYRDTWATCEKCGKQFIFTVEEQRRLSELGFEITLPTLCPDCQKKAERAPGPHEGIIKWYDVERGYGFIIQRSGNEIFFHRTGIAPGETPDFPDGTRVTYLVEQTRRGPQAVDVARINET
ncbi:MAG: hypothetical protein DRI79_03665 [Chloroflexi bacterium]|nr:MAG: hypothetical protein DRI80_00980 [Chloroflexota bacterium]RLC91137.1 MAG: hypothetical protein DRI79_03665 [Chloroflexota bacterium]HEY68452.1 cold shock domain-containing protein [Thermoflexia bacterium]